MPLQHAFWDRTCAEALTDARLLAAMARFEGALALASVPAGLVPEAAANTISQVAAKAEFDVEAIATAARLSGTLTLPSLAPVALSAVMVGRRSA